MVPPDVLFHFFIFFFFGAGAGEEQEQKIDQNDKKILLISLCISGAIYHKIVIYGTDV